MLEEQMRLQRAGDSMELKDQTKEAEVPLEGV